MSNQREVTVLDLTHWCDHVYELTEPLATETELIRRPEADAPASDEALVFTQPGEWANSPEEVAAALVAAGGFWQPLGWWSSPRPSGKAPAEARLVFTVEEAAKLLGISCSFAYEAVQRGDIPSMRIGRRILVPKVVIERFLQIDTDRGV